MTYLQMRENLSAQFRQGAAMIRRNCVDYGLFNDCVGSRLVPAYEGSETASLATVATMKMPTYLREPKFARIAWVGQKMGWLQDAKPRDSLDGVISIGKYDS